MIFEVQTAKKCVKVFFLICAKLDSWVMEQIRNMVTLKCGYTYSLNDEQNN